MIPMIPDRDKCDYVIFCSTIQLKILLRFAGENVCISYRIHILYALVIILRKL